MIFLPKRQTFKKSKKRAKGSSNYRRIDLKDSSCNHELDDNDCFKVKLLSLKACKRVVSFRLDDSVFLD
jgi:hypothetical protein